MKGKGKERELHTGKSAKKGDVVGIEHVFAQRRLSDTVISHRILSESPGMPQPPLRCNSICQLTPNAPLSLYLSPPPLLYAHFSFRS